jgi:hypothetical protein
MDTLAKTGENGLAHAVGGRTDMPGPAGCQGNSPRDSSCYAHEGKLVSFLVQASIDKFTVFL